MDKTAIQNEIETQELWQTMQEPVAAGVSPLPTCISYQEQTDIFLLPVV